MAQVSKQQQILPSWPKCGTDCCSCCGSISGQSSKQLSRTSLHGFPFISVLLPLHNLTEYQYNASHRQQLCKTPSMKLFLCLRNICRWHFTDIEEMQITTYIVYMMNLVNWGRSSCFAGVATVWQTHQPFCLVHCEWLSCSFDGHVWLLIRFSLQICYRGRECAFLQWKMSPQFCFYLCSLSLMYNIRKSDSGLNSILTKYVVTVFCTI